MDGMSLKKEPPLWVRTKDPLGKHNTDRRRSPALGKLRRYKASAVAAAALLLWTAGSCAVTAGVVRRNTTKAVTAEITASIEAEYAEKLQAYIDEHDAVRRVVGSESMQAQIAREADAIGRAIGPMKTRRMKRSFAWNILTRVDNPGFPDSVEEVLAVPGQWIFYDESNPIREDDRQLALEIVLFWHDGRYPAELTMNHVYGEWSENDYVLRDTYDKTSKTTYWRAPDEG